MRKIISMRILNNYRRIHVARLRLSFSEFYQKNKIISIGLLLTLAIVIIIVILLIYISAEHYSSIGSLLSGLGAFLAFLWIALSLSVQIKELATQNNLRRNELSNSFLSSMRENMNLVLNDINLLTDANQPQRASFDLNEAPYIFVSTANLKEIFSQDNLKTEPALDAHRLEYIAHVEYTLRSLRTIDDKSYTITLFQRSIYFRIYQLISS